MERKRGWGYLFVGLRNDVVWGKIQTQKAGQYLPEGLFLLFVSIIYLCLHNIYRTANVDDAWSLSFAYNFLYKHISYDLTFGAVTGGCGVMYFGKTYAFIYGAVLNFCGWTKSNSIYLSSVFLWLAAMVWYFIIRRITGVTKMAVWFTLLMLIIEPFFEAANEARPDALTFLLVSAAFLAMIYGKTFLAALIAMIAVETHPLGIIAFFYILVEIIVSYQTDRLERKKLLEKTLYFLLGIGLGILYYYLLHYQFLGTLKHGIFVSNSGSRPFNNFISEYFFFTDFARHAPELLLIAAALVVFIRQKYYQDNPYILILLIVLPCATLIVKRPNFRYILYVYPVFLLLILDTFRRMKRFKLPVLIYLILLIPPYTWFFLHHHDYNLNAYLRKIKAAVPHNRIPVVGGANDWFAFKSRSFYTLNYNSKFGRLRLKEFYLIENPNYRRAEYPRLALFIKRHYTGKTISEFRVNRELYRVKLEKAKAR